MTVNILVVDDELSMRQFLEILLKKEGYLVETASNGEKALEKLKLKHYQVVLMDYNMPESIDGLQLLNEIRKSSKHSQVVIITAYASTEQAIKAIELGAIDYVSKPFNVAEIKDIVKKSLAEYKMKSPEIKSELHSIAPSKSVLVFESRQMKRIIDFSETVAPTDSTVLITGESGAGKEVIARYIHQKSRRANGPWYPINCGAIPENLQESLFFGHEKGSFTGATETKKGYFEVANKGTLFLDEVGELSENMQVKLLRVLQEKKFMRVGGTESYSTDVRLIAATNKDLKKEIEKGFFREDLFFRLNVLEIHVPPLRERKEDIMPLTNVFVEQFNCELNKNIKLSESLEKYLLEYNFPGNVRELHNMIERGAVLSKNNEMAVEDIKAREHRINEYEVQNIDDKPQILFDNPINLDEILASVERKYINAALEKTGWNKHKTALLLGMTERSLRYRMDKLGLKELGHE